MTQPLRRPLQRDDLDIETTLQRHLNGAPEIELGMSLLRQEMRDAGWPARTPEGDRKPSAGNPEEPSAIDYADPTGDMATRLTHLANDLEAMQDHWHLVATSLRAMAMIARKHIPAASPAVPACSVSTCEDHVEAKVVHGRLIYVGMDQIAGLWVAKPGVKPTCSGHRRMRGAA